MLKDFKNYEAKELETQVTEFLNKDDFTLLYLEETIFFPESAGQVSDKGVIIFNDEEYKVLSLAISDNKVVHKVELIKDIQVGSKVIAKIDKNHRLLVSQNHSAAHLLFDTLREFFPTSKGKGYFNDDKGFRIDMQIEEKIDWNVIYKINEVVTKKRRTAKFRKDIIVDAKTAKEQYNLSIEFNEKELEGDLRIVQFGDVSTQLCSGTHVENLLEIFNFLIYDFESKGSKVFRFYAKTDEKLVREQYSEFTKKEMGEISRLIGDYAGLNKKFGKNEKMEEVLERFAQIKKDLLYPKWESYIKLKILTTDFREAMKEFSTHVDAKVKDNLYNKYKDYQPDLEGEFNIFKINERNLERKDYLFICDVILKNNKNAYVEVVNKEAGLFFCKSNCAINAFERMDQHLDYIVKGGGNEKTAQGVIIERGKLKN
ncbi:alanine--tRNA ligase-related protein [Spiroplasma sp. BIUS-1]|uniref:alanine--tRNA ligase-related protein n=1 Tax=Spiroplasma sp. BIUS-1 TaxID=216964 RepID=UPI0013975A7A|nr:alanine--tRNA ligase-related protein [Spiroplasma sp. BIUS-1]QHX36769.1 alanyl-tRNA synthetase [Spiroplasma sp. BIUS-1]